jgi:hypothetical protein
VNPPTVPQRTNVRSRLRVIYRSGASADEIRELEAQAAAELGIDPAHVDWIHRILITPPPVVELPSELCTAPLAEMRDPVLGQPRQSFTRKPDAAVIERPTVSRTEPPERPTEIEYPPSGVA